MRARQILLILAVLAVAGFAALNWSEFIRTAPLSFGTTVRDAPLGLILLGLLGLAFLALLTSMAAHRRQVLVESRHHFKALEAQRALAEKAEASRFTELRTYLDGQLRDLRQRDAIAAGELERSAVNGQRELRTQLEQINRTLAARLAEIENRLDARLARVPGYEATSTTVTSTPRREWASYDPVAPVAERPGGVWSSTTEDPSRSPSHDPQRDVSTHDMRLRGDHVRDEHLHDQRTVSERLHDEHLHDDRLRPERADDEPREPLKR